MIEFRNISITHKDSGRQLYKSFNFILNEGDKAVIIGEEGNGKSTLLKLAYDERLIEDYCSFTGEVYKRDVKLGYLEQEMNRDDLDKTVKAYMEGVDPYSIHDKELWEMTDAILTGDQKVGTLSGGEKVKLRLAKLLSEQPDALLLDEPTNDLDLKTLAWLERFIQSSQVPILFVSHDETLIERTANILIHVEQVRRKSVPRATVVRMNYADYIAQRSSLLSKQEQVARKQREEYHTQMERWQQIYNKVEHRQETISRGDPAGGRLLKKKMKSLKSQEKRIQRDADFFTELPDVEDAVAFGFQSDTRIPNGKRVLDFSLERLESGERLLAENIRLQVFGPEHIAIIGENGAGKTTLLKRIKDSMEGRKDIKIGYMPQNYLELLDYDQTPVGFLSPSGKKEDRTKAYTFLGSMRYTPEEMNSRIGELSGGQKAKLIILSLILNGFDVLLLDEPTRNFSPLSNPVIRGALSAYGGTLLSVTHDRKFLSEVCTAVYELKSDGLYKVPPDKSGCLWD